MSRNESIGYLTSVLYRKNQLYLNQALKPFDLSSSEMLILHRLCTHGECSQEEVASHLMIDKAAITRAVQSLEKKGWLTRSRSETDKRAFILKPLQKSYDHQTEFLSIMSYWTEFLTDGMSREEVTVLFRLLTSMQERLRDADFQAINDRRQNVKQNTEQKRKS
jgi:DNA-binding MarR family transcriptional regulator